MLNKLAEEKVVAVLADVPNALRALSKTAEDWKARALVAEEKVADHAHRERIEKLASSMESKGLATGRDRESRIALLEKKAAEGALDAVEQAIEMSAPQHPLGELVDLGNVESTATSDFVSAIMGD